ncbi:MAG: hypothetical protein ACRDN0_03370 [Trebonia sp.]
MVEQGAVALERDPEPLGVRPSVRPSVRLSAVAAPQFPQPHLPLPERAGECLGRMLDEAGRVRHRGARVVDERRLYALPVHPQLV